MTVTGQYPDQVFDLQTQIASKLVTSFNVAASKAETDKMADVMKSPGNYTAYELYMKGRNADLLGTEAGNQEAVLSFRKAIELKPDFAPAYYNLGIVLKKQGKDGEAIVAYRKAIELKPNDADPLENLALLLDAKGVRKEAREYWEKAFKLEKDPKWVERITKRLAEKD